MLVSLFMVSAAFAAVNEPNIQCLNKLALFEYGDSVQEKAGSFQKNQVTVELKVDDKNEVFTWDGKKIWRLKPEAGARSVDPSKNSKEEIWSAERHQAEHDGRASKSLSEDTLEALIDLFIAQSFSTMHSLGSEFGKSKGIYEGCREVDVKVFDKRRKVSAFIKDISAEVLQPKDKKGRAPAFDAPASTEEPNEGEIEIAQ